MKAENEAVRASTADRRGKKEPRPPILQARFTAARVVYLQRFTMELVSVAFASVPVGCCASGGVGSVLAQCRAFVR